MSVVVLIPAIWLLCGNGVDLQSCGILPGSSPSPASFSLQGACAIGKWRTVRVLFMVISRKKKAISCIPESPWSREHPQIGRRRHSLHSPCWAPPLLCGAYCRCVVSLPALDYCPLSSYLLEWGWRSDVQPSLLHPLLLMILQWLRSGQIQNSAF